MTLALKGRDGASGNPGVKVFFLKNDMKKSGKLTNVITIAYK